jgi:hypothetical protein
MGLMKFEDGPCVGKVGRQVDCDGAAVERGVGERHGSQLGACMVTCLSELWCWPLFARSGVLKLAVELF